MFPRTTRETQPEPGGLTRYQMFVTVLLAVLQFTVILDFAILAPLGAIVMPKLRITTGQFGLLVSAYAFSAAFAGLVAAGYADRFDRKKVLTVFYTGFLFGTFLCGIASGYHFLLVARVVTGLFGGVIGSISLSIVADLFPLEVRGRVMGTIQSAFSAAQILGIPAGLFLANVWGWRSPFLVICILGLAVGAVIVIRLQPLTGHISTEADTHPIRKLLGLATNPRYINGLTAVILVATGGFMIQPFASAFAVNNLGVALGTLPVVYMVAGVFGLFAGPLLGKAADVYGKFRLFAISSALATAYVVWYTGLGPTSLWVVIAANSVFAIVLAGRIASSMAIVSAVPAPSDRGAYMAVSASAQQLSGAVAAWVAGLIVHQTADGRIEHFHVIGIIVATTMLITVAQMYRLNKVIRHPAVAEAA